MASLAAAALTTIINHAIKQAQSKQDFAASGSNDKFDFIVIADTHGRGRNKFVLKFMLESINWSDLLSHENFFEELQTKIKKIDTHQIGSTLSVCKIFTDRFETYWVGDSTIKIFKNAEEIYKTKDHDYNNEEDINRIKQLDTFLSMSPAQDIAAISPTEMSQVKSKVFRFGSFEKIESINMTHSLGHNQKTGDFISHETIPRENDQKYKVIAGSDGFWQVTCGLDNEVISSTNTTSEELVELASIRWHKYWNLKDKNGKMWSGIKFPENNIDDVAVACWYN